MCGACVPSNIRISIAESQRLDRRLSSLSLCVCVSRQWVDSALRLDSTSANLSDS